MRKRDKEFALLLLAQLRIEINETGARLDAAFTRIKAATAQADALDTLISNCDKPRKP